MLCGPSKVLSRRDIRNDLEKKRLEKVEARTCSIARSALVALLLPYNDSPSFTMSSATTWLHGQRKTELVDLAEKVGLKEYVVGCRIDASRTNIADQLREPKKS